MGAPPVLKSWGVVQHATAIRAVGQRMGVRDSRHVIVIDEFFSPLPGNFGGSGMSGFIGDAEITEPA
jgi:hypothetical protein